MLLLSSQINISEVSIKESEVLEIEMESKTHEQENTETVSFESRLFKFVLAEGFNYEKDLHVQFFRKWFGSRGPVK